MKGKGFFETVGDILTETFEEVSQGVNEVVLDAQRVIKKGTARANDYIRKSAKQKEINSLLRYKERYEAELDELRTHQELEENKYIGSIDANILDKEQQLYEALKKDKRHIIRNAIAMFILYTILWACVIGVLIALNVKGLGIVFTFSYMTMGKVASGVCVICGIFLMVAILCFIIGLKKYTINGIISIEKLMDEYALKVRAEKEIYLEKFRARYNERINDLEEKLIYINESIKLYQMDNETN